MIQLNQFDVFCNGTQYIGEIVQLQEAGTNIIVPGMDMNYKSGKTPYVRVLVVGPQAKEVIDVDDVIIPRSIVPIMIGNTTYVSGRSTELLAILKLRDGEPPVLWDEDAEVIDLHQPIQ